MDQEYHRRQEEAEQARESTRRLKRRMLVVIAVLLGVLILLGGAVALLEQLTAQEEDTGDDTSSVPPHFYSPDPTCNILEDPDYLGMDRRIYLTRNNETTVITEDNIQNYGPAVQTIKAMIDCLVMGDHEGYNALFSTHYYATEGNEPKGEFTMQRIYDIQLEFCAQSNQKDNATGKTYTQYEIIVKYKIARNDGTFRQDIGSNEARKQYYVLSDSTGSQVLIDQIGSYNYQQVVD